ncbi:MAG: acyl carrier protein [Patescibacteria group bacterium]|jgi:acyl carrier protein
MEVGNVQRQVARILCLVTGVEENRILGDLGQHLIDDFNADSFDFVNLVIKLESRFDLEIPDEIVEERFTTVGSIVEYITARLA